MEWLLKNWIFVAFAVGVGFYLFRGRLGAHMGGHNGMTGGIGHGGHGESDVGHAATQVAMTPRDAAVDPVGGEAVRTELALTSLYEGKVFYFASKENRERFEAGPREYAQKAVGHPVQSAQASENRPRKHGGCC